MEVKAHELQLNDKSSVKIKCSICGRLFSEDNHGVAMPFCSRRCKLIDAGRWLNEEYGFPLEDEESILEQ
jgi:endogenous inhibitor of DNA gyrase (YacG/DUF329 family)